MRLHSPPQSAPAVAPGGEVVLVRVIFAGAIEAAGDQGSRSGGRDLRDGYCLLAVLFIRGKFRVVCVLFTTCLLAVFTPCLRVDFRYMFVRLEIKAFNYTQSVIRLLF